MFRKSIGGWLMLLVLGPACALALEIGEIQVNSSLNQLFDAKIPLPGVKPEDLDKVSIKLAPPPMFKEFNLERTALLAKLVFSVEYNPEGDVYVKVVSTQPVREPSLGLLLEFGWPRGKTYREFTVFLDPVKRLAKSSGDRTKTVLNESAAAAPVAPLAVAAEATSAASAPPPLPAMAGAAASAPAAATEPVKPAPPPVAMPAPISPAPTAAVPVTPAEVATPAPASAPPPAPVTVAEAKPVPAQTPAVAASTPSSAPAPAATPVSATPPPPPAPSPASTPAPTPPVTAPPSASIPVESVADSRPPVAAAAAGSQVVTATPASPMETTSAPSQNKQYKAGDSYGPVGAGDRLWKIALKLSPDPSITPEQMMKALHKVNPKAFSKAGVDGLIAGSILRVPSLREIADYGGSAAARRLADSKTVSPSSTSDESAPKAEEKIELLQVEVEVDGLKTYPLPLQPSLEPMPVEGLALTAGWMPSPSVVEPALASLTAIGPTPSGKAGQPPLAERLEALKLAKGSTPELALEADKRPKSSVTASSFGPVRALPPPLLEPVSATPLLFSATLDVVTAALNIPAFAIPIQIAPESIIADDHNPPDMRASAKGGAISPAIADPRKALAFKTAKPVVGTATSASDEVALKAPAQKPKSVAGEHYGPVTANERLWDIAARLRPDPSISKDAMMRALFLANPQAFAKTGMDQMKVGATLRIPSLAEIVKHTGSKEAKQLLEQRQNLERPSSKEPAPLSSN